MNLIRHILRNLRGDQRGSIAIETVFYIPLLIFTFAGFAVGADAYRDINFAKKASFAVADIISREKGTVRQSNLINYVKAFAYAAQVSTSITSSNLASRPVAVRVTSVLYDESDTVGGVDDVSLQFSMTSSATQLPAHTAASLQGIKNKIPTLQDGDSIILVETRVQWTPIISSADALKLVDFALKPKDMPTWISARNIDTFVTVRPRYVSSLCWQVGMSVSPCGL